MRGTFFAFLCVLVCNKASGQTLRSPWDGQEIRRTEAPYTCPTPPPFTSTIDPGTYYIDARASVIDPGKQAAYLRVTEAPIGFSRSVTTAADAWLSQGSQPAARCVYALLEAAARAEAWAGKMPDFSGVIARTGF